MTTHGYLSGVSEDRVRGAILEGIEFLRNQTPERQHFEYKDLVGQVARVLLTTKSSQAFNAWRHSQNTVNHGPNNLAAEDPDIRKLLTAFWRLVGEGIVFPRFSNVTHDGQPHLMYSVTLTERGERLASHGELHPLHPGFVARFQKSAPTATAQVVTCMEDAVTCLEAQVLRPALMMLGVANEETIRVAHAALVHEKKIRPTKTPMAVARDLLADIKHAVSTVPGSKDDKHRLDVAIGLMEVVRVARNRATHPNKVTDSADVESLLVQGAHHLPVVWELLVTPAVANGFVLT